MKIIIISILSLLTSIVQAQNFSGQIAYSTQVTFSDTTYKYIDYQKAKYGDSLIIYIDKSGKIKRQYKGTGNPGFEYFIINPENNFSINKFTYSDSIFLSNKLVESTQLIKIDTLGNDTVLNRVCEVYQLKLLESNTDNFDIWTITLWIDKNLKLKKEAYNDWKEGHWNIISSLNNGMFLKMITTNNFMSIKHEATEIENRDLDQNLFNYDKRWIIELE